VYKHIIRKILNNHLLFKTLCTDPGKKRVGDLVEKTTRVILDS